MSGSDRISLSNEDFSAEYKNSFGDNIRRSLLSLSTSRNSTRGTSLNSPNDSSFLFKRKIEDDTSTIQDKRKKEDSSLCVSPWEFRRLRADLIESRAQIVKLEDRIDELHKKNKETVIFFDKEKSEMKLQLESNRTAVKDLEYRLHKVRKREAECREELSELKKTHESEQSKLSEKLLLLGHENAELKSKLDELRSSSETSVTELKSNIQNLTEENARLKLNIDEKNQLCKNLEEKLSAATEALSSAEETKEELHTVHLKLKELESEKAEFEEARKLTVVLSDKVLQLPEIEKELNAKRQEVINLRQAVHNKVLLEEMVHNLKVKLAAVEDREKQIPAFKAKLAEFEIEIKKWVDLAAEFANDSTAESLRTCIQNLQDKELTSGLEINNLNGEKSTLENKISSLQLELEGAKEMNEKLKSTIQKLKVEVQVLRKKSVLVTRERDSYRQQLDLYEKDLTMSGITSQSLSDEVINQMKERIRTLEESLQEYRKHVELLETRLKEYDEEDQTDNVLIVQKLKDEIRNLEESNKFLSKIRDELEHKLETRALKGQYLSPDVKVLHFKENPVAEAQRRQKEDVSNLREECDRLKARVRLLESGEALNITQKVSENLQNFSSERIKELEKELDSANLKMQRLKEVYRKTSQEFCDVSHMLLGYRIVLVSNNKLYKLCNMYSNSPSDYLMFQQTKDGTMEMLGTPFAESLSKLVDEYLHKGNSIPAFLAAVTLSLYKSSEQSEEDDDDGDDDDDDDDDEEDGGNEEPPEEIELD